MKDFADEVPGYTQNQSIMELLENVELEAGAEHIHRNLQICYETLSDAGCISRDELRLLDAWLDDISSLT